MAAADSIRAKALALGFDAVGLAPAALAEDASSGLRDFLAAGHHGAMGWLAERSTARGHPRALWPEARSVVCAGLSYAPAEDPLATLARPGRGNISVYARHRDYHDLLKGRLKHLGQFIASRFAVEVKIFVDTAPVMEKPLAQQAGLGWQGKHTSLVSRRHGSWLFLGEIYTTLELPPDAPHADRCGSCSRCLAACPTDAFPAPYRLDATRCLSYLSIEHPGPIPAEFRPAMGNRIYGCDDCLAVCPWNRFAAATREAKLQARPDLIDPPLAELAGLDDAGFRARFAGSPVKRIGRHRFVRNVLIAIGNSGDAALAPAAARLLADPDPVVAEAAAWAVARLRRVPQTTRCETLNKQVRYDPEAGSAMSVLVKRSFTLAGHRTSVALEPEFWAALTALAAGRGVVLSALVAEVDAARAPERPLASALRVHALAQPG